MIIHDLADRENDLHLSVVDEVAAVKSEVDNSITVSALIKGLRSFDDSESHASDLSFLTEATYQSPSSPKKSKQSILMSFQSRRYSYENRNSGDIDVSTIDVDVLDTSIRIAEDHGLYSDRAKRLYRTVQLMRSMRLAMKQCEWLLLEQLLVEATLYMDHDGDDGGETHREVGGEIQGRSSFSMKYDKLAAKEIQVLKCQLEIRTAIVDLSKQLKTGRAKCNNGIVDASSVSCSALEIAIERAQRSISELTGMYVVVIIGSIDHARNDGDEI